MCLHLRGVKISDVKFRFSIQVDKTDGNDDAGDEEEHSPAETEPESIL